MIKNKFYVYGHFLLTGEIFYVGKGRGNRAYVSSGRNIHWKRKVTKHGGFIVSILQDQLDEGLAFEVEKSFIESIGRENLVNMTDGGEGASGYKHSEETLMKIGDASRGENNPNYGKSPSEETRKKMIESHIGKMVGDKSPMFGKSPSEETRKKMRESHIGIHTGDKHPMFGKLGKDNPNSKKVNQYSKDGEFIKTWDSMIDVSRELKIKYQSISACCRGIKKSAGGFLWRYA